MEVKWYRKPLKHTNSCSACKCKLEEGVYAYMRKPYGKKWEFLCEECHAKVIMKPEEKPEENVDWDTLHELSLLEFDTSEDYSGNFEKLISQFGESSDKKVILPQRSALDLIAEKARWNFA